MDISNKDTILSLFEREKFDIVIHLADQAGVRYSIENPDAVEDIKKLMVEAPEKTVGNAKHTVYNIGNNQPEKLMVFINSLEQALSNSLGREVKFKKIYEPIEPGDVHATYADTDRLHETIGFKPETSIQDGLQQFTDWYIEYYNKK